METKEELKQFAEAMLDVQRLKIVGEIAKGSGQVLTLARKAGLDVETTLAHLQVLSQAGVVTLSTQENGEQIYLLNEKALEAMSKRQFEQARANATREPDLRDIPSRFTPEEAKYIRSFTFNNGKITHLPSINAKAKLMAVLHYAMQDLEAGRIYTEAEFNRALGRFTSDASSVRRELVDWGFVDRKVDGSAYWLREGGDD